MYKPQNEIERKLIETIFESLYAQSFMIATPGYYVTIERNDGRVWDEQGRLLANLDIVPLNADGTPIHDDLMAGEIFPIYLFVDEINEDKFVEGVRIGWHMPANTWSNNAQTNIWPFKPSLRFYTEGRSLYEMAVDAMTADA